MRFSWGSISESLLKRKSKLTKLFNVCWKQLLLKSRKSTWLQQMLNNFVNFDTLTKQGGHAWRYVFLACSKLETMGIYLLKQACGNEHVCKLGSNLIFSSWLDLCDFSIFNFFFPITEFSPSFWDIVWNLFHKLPFPLY